MGVWQLHLYQDLGVSEAGCNRMVLLRMALNDLGCLLTSLLSGDFESSLNNVTLTSGEKQHLEKLLVFRELCTFIFNSAKDAF